MSGVKKTWLILSWVGATALVSFITFQGLSAAQGGVNDSPLTPVVVATTAIDAAASATTVDVGIDDSTGTTQTAGTPPTSNPTESTGQTSLAGSDDGTSSAGQPGGTAAATTSTTVAPNTTTTATESTSTTAAAATTTTAAWTITTITSPGGSVTVSYRPGEVRYEAGTPAAGYEIEIDKTSPEVRVEFHGHDHDLPDYEIRARWTSDGFDSEVGEK